MKLLVVKMQVEKITRTNENDRHALVRSFSRQSTDHQVTIVSSHRTLLYKLQQKYHDIKVPIATLSYCALIIAIQLDKVDQEKLKRLNISDMSLDEIREITAKRTKLFLKKQFRKQSKRECLLNYWSVVRSLKIDEHVSFRKIAVYLKKYHKIDVSYSLIAKTWTEIERKDEKNG